MMSLLTSKLICYINRFTLELSICRCFLLSNISVKAFGTYMYTLSLYMYRGCVAQSVAHLACNQSVSSLNPYKGLRCFLEQEPLPSLLYVSGMDLLDFPIKLHIFVGLMEVLPNKLPR